MRTFLNLLIILLIFSSCALEENYQLPLLSEPSAMNVFCQVNSNESLRRVEYEYDMEKLISETTLVDGDILYTTNFTYNNEAQLVYEIFESDYRKSEKTFIYNEMNQLVNIKFKFTDFDGNGNMVSEGVSEAPREFEHNLLVKEWESWGGFSTYEYTNGQLKTKIDYTKNAEKHHVTTYKFAKNLLIEEKKETVNGGLIYFKTYKYDAQKRLIKIFDRENIIEENLYIDDKLIERKINYFGIDPGYYPCLGNFKYTFDY